MGAVTLRVRSWLRGHVGAALATSLLVALAMGAVLVLAAGARRTDSAPARYTHAAGGDPDALVYQFEGPPQTAQIAALPAVADLNSITFVGLEVAGAHAGLDANPFAGTSLTPGTRLVAGRPTNPAAPFEFVANRSFADALDVQVGDRVEFLAADQGALDTGTIDSPGGSVPVTGTLVGITDGPDDIDDPTPSVVFSSALLTTIDVGIESTLVGVWLREGFDVAAFRAQLDTLPGGSELGLGELTIISPSLRNAVDAQAQALWVITIVVAIAAVAAVGQVLVRQARLSRVERDTLRALGTTRAHTDLESLWRAAIPVVTGAALAAVAAAACSGLFPTGFVRRLEPDRGPLLDGTVLTLGPVLVAAAILAWVGVALLLSRRPERSPRPSSLVEALAGRAPSVPARAGTHFALARHERDTVSVLGTTVGLVLAVAGVIASVVFATSLRALAREGDRYGANFDLVIGHGWLPPQPQLAEQVLGEDDVTAAVLLGSGFARHGDVSVELIGAQSLLGGLQPRVLAGRAPVSADEVALGRLTATSLGVGVGDDLVLTGEGAEATLRVVGIVVVPSIGPNVGVGEGAIVTIDGLTTLAPESGVQAVGVVLTHAARRDVDVTAQQLTESIGVPAFSMTVPASIVNVARVQRVPVILAVLLAVLGTATLVHTLVSTVRARRRDLAVVSALGADRHHLGRIVRWQATITAAVPLLIGIPLGLVVGRLVFRSFADRIGAVPDPSTPLLVTALAAAALVVIANGAAVGAATLGSRTRVTQALRTE